MHFLIKCFYFCEDPDGAELGKLLEMKGLKRSDQLTYMELFKEANKQVLPKSSSTLENF